MKKLLVVLFCFSFITSVFAEELEYSVLNEEKHDSPVKAQVVLNILVSGNVTEKNLTALLNKLCSSIKSRRGFKYHDSPTNVYIYAFISKEQYDSEMGLWIAMLDKSYNDSTPNIYIDKKQISQINVKTEEKFGLSESKRKQIWKELVEAEDKALIESEKKYPLPDVYNPGYSQSLFLKQYEKQSDFQIKLDKKYKHNLAKKYKLTPEQLNKIATEGVSKKWPFPKMK